MNGHISPLFEEQFPPITSDSRIGSKFLSSEHIIGIEGCRPDLYVIMH